MTAPPRALEADWLGASRRAVDALRSLLEARPTTAERVLETGTRGQGGDRTLEIDAEAEEAIFLELDHLHDAGARFTAVSEERGVVEYGDPAVRVLIDPIDGSLNAKRGVPHHALSLAVAHGSTMADVVFGYVYDFGTAEEWYAVLGEGARLNGVLLPRDAEERRSPSGRLELLGLEAADPRLMRDGAAALAEVASRFRALGAIAVTLCEVASARFDGMVTLKRCRSVDVAAGQLIVREAGGHVAFPYFEAPLGAPLDLIGHSPLVAARTERALAELARVPPAR